MTETARECVRKALTFQSPSRPPRDLWVLPWANRHLPDCLAELNERWPADIAGAPRPYRPSSRVQGDMFEVGTYVDEWGCIFTNIHWGIIGEVRDPVLPDLDAWEDVVQPPDEILPVGDPDAVETVNRACADSSKFMLANSTTPRPWERYQFLRGTEEAMMDLMDLDDRVLGVLDRIHQFYLREIDFWCGTDVDGMCFMDDWGSQQSLLIPPPIWREVFKPMYREYVERLHAADKFAFMHSDGQIMSIYPDLVEIGVDAMNSQLFCMDMSQVRDAAGGQLCFWGEIDRQLVLPSLKPEDGIQAARKYYDHMYRPDGGVIFQFELTPGSHPETVIAVCEEWERLTQHPY